MTQMNKQVKGTLLVRYSFDYFISLSHQFIKSIQNHFFMIYNISANKKTFYLVWLFIMYCLYWFILNGCFTTTFVFIRNAHISSKLCFWGFFWNWYPFSIFLLFFKENKMKTIEWNSLIKMRNKKYHIYSFFIACISLFFLFFIKKKILPFFYSVFSVFDFLF